MKQLDPEHVRILRMPIRAYMTIADFRILCPDTGKVGATAEADLGMTQTIHLVDHDVSIQTMSYGMGSADDQGMRTVNDMEFYVRADPDLTIDAIADRLRGTFGDRMVRIATEMHDHVLHDWEIVRQDGETRLRGYVEDAITGDRTPATTSPVDPEDRYEEYRVIHTATARYRLGEKAVAPVPAPSLVIPSDMLRSTAATHPDAVGSMILALAYDHATRSVRPHMIPDAAVPDHVRRDIEQDSIDSGSHVTAYEAPDHSFRIVFSDLLEGMTDCYVVLPDGPTLRSPDAGYEAFHVLKQD